MRTGANYVKYYFHEVNLSNGHDGLLKYAQGELKKAGHGWEALKQGEFAVFYNKNLNAMKMLMGNNSGTNYAFFYLRLPRSRRINLSVVKYLPNYLNGPDIDYPKAMKDSLAQKFQEFYGDDWERMFGALPEAMAEKAVTKTVPAKKKAAKKVTRRR